MTAARKCLGGLRIVHGWRNPPPVIDLDLGLVGHGYLFDKPGDQLGERRPDGAIEDPDGPGRLAVLGDDIVRRPCCHTSPDQRDAGARVYPPG